MFLAILLSFLLTNPAYADNVLMPDYVGRYTTPSGLDDEIIIDDSFDDDLESEDYYATDSEYFNDDSARDSSFSGSLADYFLALENKPQNVDSVSDEDLVVMDDSQAPVLLAPLNRVFYYDDYKNCVIYSGRFGGSYCRLVVPYDSYKSLTVVDGVLLNIGNSNITGRFLYGSKDLTHNDYDTYNYVLSPVYGSTSGVWRYGSFNYQRHYYLYTNSTSGTQSIQYSDSYGNFIVDDVVIHFATQERLYYVGLVGLILGGLFICLKH